MDGSGEVRAVKKFFAESMPQNHESLAQHIHDIRRELKFLIEPAYREGAIRFFKEPIKVLGVRTPSVRRLARKHRPQTGIHSKQEIFDACEEFLRSGWNEETTIACAWAADLRKQFHPSDFPRWERWIKTYVTNWSICDDFCSHVMGPFLVMFPEFLSRIELWAHAKNRWMRRASAVSLIVPLRHGLYLDEAFHQAEVLLQDEDDLVQKGYGWMLKGASACFPDQVFTFVMDHRKTMPRTALRYAIEKYPAHLRRQAMD